ncbi:MAG: site-specific integrase [Candidatus Methanomethylophilaceae archaeon]|nr:site-specific integrase [Candidatus Methanomethylophilaceae archaeon]
MEDGASLRAADLKKVRLGRYPFKAGIKYFVARRAPYLATSTLEENTRKLRYLADVIENMSERGMIASSDPRRIDRHCIEEVLLFLKGKHLEISTKEKYLSILKSYLKLWGNNCIDELQLTTRLLPPKPVKEIRALSVGDIAAILEEADRVPGHMGEIIRGMIALTFATGIRPKESIDAEIGDMDMRGHRFYVRHPKGEESWASPQWVYMIRGDMFPRIEAYMVYRRSILPDNRYLFPNPRTGIPYCQNTIRRQCRRLSQSTGVLFRMKDLRSSLASITVADDLTRLKAVSLQLRHTKLSTTESFYAKIENDRVEKEIGSVWKEDPVE